jgi:hypothetical protein
MFQQVTGAIIKESTELLPQQPQNGSMHRNTVTQLYTLKISVKTQEYSQHKYLKHYRRRSFEHHAGSYSTNSAHIQHSHDSTHIWIPRWFPDDHQCLMKIVEPTLTVCMMLEGTSLVFWYLCCEYSHVLTEIFNLRKFVTVVLPIYYATTHF